MRFLVLLLLTGCQTVVSSGQPVYFECPLDRACYPIHADAGTQSKGQ